jgi:2,3-bisphosphoglycerate-independent phosphoglycerate mutase
MPLKYHFKPVILIILDGWGIAPISEGNPISRANIPVVNRLIRTYPTFTLRASGAEVGLSWGEMGNSEVGHLTIGAGRVFYQTFPRISKAIADGSFFKNEVLLRAVHYAQENNSRLHFIGLVSPGGVHSHQEHLYALLELAKREGVKKVAVQAILDGRDTLRDAGIDFITKLQNKMKEIGVGEIASLSGRYYAMDRDNRWDRTAKAYAAMVYGEGEKEENPLEAIKKSYEKQIFDEEFIPTVIVKNGKPVAPVTNKDAVIFFNFREDRMRQLVKAFVLPAFEKFERREFLKDSFFVTMTEYEKDLPVKIAFPPEVITTCLAKVVSEHGLKQFHIAETEKYAHITFFLNGMREEPFPGEEREIIPSPKVPSYDQKPEMSTEAITEKVMKVIMEEKYDFIAINFANPDMVAHTGNIEATIKAIEVTDKQVGRIVEVALFKGGAVVITADHGNAEELINLQTGKIDKEHSTNPVPLIVVGKNLEGQINSELEAAGWDLSLISPRGALVDVAPTVLALLGLPKPKEMTGTALVY